ncbi:MAG TPA: ABC transporter permease [Candidatus Binataceae bacterium]|nr:ABC transporter permease [Candidatus Binataceae bacterium]
MNNFSLRKIWLVAKREYLERVLTRSFILATLATPALLALLAALPSMLTSHLATGLAMNSGHTIHVAVACDDSTLGNLVRDRLTALSSDTYVVTLESSVSPEQRKALQHRVEDQDLDGFVWLDAQAAATHSVRYTTRNVTDFVLQTRLALAVAYGIQAERLLRGGVSPSEIGDILSGIDLKVIKVGAASTFDALRGALVVIVMVCVIFISLLTYGVVVMRSVLEEKASRITEVLLCSTTAQELMTGKIIGVGSVGATQIGVWLGMCALAVWRSAYLRAMIAVLEVGPAVFIWFVVFYLLGFLLYSAIFAGVGAAFNSVDEAQQWNFVITIPLIIASSLILPVVNSPDSAIAVSASIFPFCSPVLMFERLAIQNPPFWQVALAIAALLATIFAMFMVSARIYRVGILMYGKRPSPRELWRWIKQS